MTKHEPTETKQLNYPGGKNGMWNSRCSAGDYVSPPSESPFEAENKVLEHAASKVARAANVQILQEADHKVVIATEIQADSRLELFMEKQNSSGVGDQFVSAFMDYDQLWEHVHNCLDALERMGRDRK